jgi:hypothetical protein
VRRVFVLVVLVASGLVAAPSADAIVTLRYVSRTAPLRPGLTSVGANCPKRFNVVSGGVEVLDVVGETVQLVSSYPVDTRRDRDMKPDDGWRGIANNSSPSTLRMRTTAICSRGMSVVYAKSDTFDVPTGDRTDRGVDCPADSHGVGGGASLTSDGSTVELATLIPLDDDDLDLDRDDGWFAGANNGSGIVQKLTVFTICATGSVLHYRDASHSFSGNPSSVAITFVECDQGLVVGGGFISSGDDLANEMRGTHPMDADFTGVADDAWRNEVKLGGSGTFTTISSVTCVLNL